MYKKALLIVAACLLFSACKKSGSVSEPLPNKIIQLDEQSKSGVHGSATLEDKGGKTRVLIMVSGSSTTPEPAHIHLGSCPSPADVKYPLNDIKGGVSDTLVPLDMKSLLSMEPLAINLHKYASDMKMYIACGNIK